MTARAEVPGLAQLMADVTAALDAGHAPPPADVETLITGGRRLLAVLAAAQVDEAAVIGMARFLDRLEALQAGGATVH